jgi:hypothetical protein
LISCDEPEGSALRVGWLVFGSRALMKPSRGRFISKEEMHNSFPVTGPEGRHNSSPI